MVTPVPARPFIPSGTSPAISGASAEVGSSNNIGLGSIARARGNRDALLFTT